MTEQEMEQQNRLEYLRNVAEAEKRMLDAHKEMVRAQSAYLWHERIYRESIYWRG